MNWQKSDKETLAPNISAFTQRFNQVTIRRRRVRGRRDLTLTDEQVSFWVATEVVTAPTPKQRMDILKKFIKSAQVRALASERVCWLTRPLLLLVRADG